MAEKPSPHDPMAAFGANEWLVDELYEQYQKDRNLVDPAWWDFFSGFTPGRPVASAASASSSSSAGTTTTAAPARPAPASPAPAPAQTRVAPTGPAVAPPANGSPASGPASAPAAASGTAAPGVPAPAPAPARPAASAPTAPAALPKPSASTPASRTAPPPRPTPRDTTAFRVTPSNNEDVVTVLKGPTARLVANMDDSLTVPTATSVRAVPAKLMIDNRVLINAHLRRNRGGKVSFTHILGYAIVRALTVMPDMNRSFTEVDGKPAVVTPAHVNFGLAIDLPKPDGTRSLVVPSIKAAERMTFFQFWNAYEELVRKARNNKLTVDDFMGTTISLTNPGTIGTVHSVPRLMKGSGCIVGAGAMEYPAEWQGAAPETIARHGIGKLMTLTSTYDHRIIQGAGSGEFLKVIHGYLIGQNGFYDEIFESLRIPYEPIRWTQDVSASHEDDLSKSARVQQLIHAYRVRGHLLADTDPLEYVMRRHADLDLATYGLTLWDLDREVATGGFGGKDMATLREIVDILQDSYCRTLGVEYMHIQEPDERHWVQNKVEVRQPKLSAQEQLRILRRLNAAEAFETFLQTKYVGQKRFSLEGGESVIALLDQVLVRAAREGMDEVCIGMPHRGRLNVLANIAGKSYGQIFREFEGTQDPRSVQGSGDVKYHLGTEGIFTSDEGHSTRVYLAANPSHLEAVNPVLEGIVRAKQDRLDKGPTGFTVLPVLMHGDAAFAGQGVVLETLQLSQLRGYRTGGTIHIVVNNQVGFTTAPSASRSSVYSTDLGRTIQAPILHVNGDDPEACVRAAELAFEFRQEFAKDVIIDMVCYRRRGHNEGDDPSMTQPLMYNLIEAKRSVRKLYTEALIGRGDITVDEAEAALRDYQGRLEQVFIETKEAAKASKSSPGSAPIFDTPDEHEDELRAQPRGATSISRELFERIGDAFTSYPVGFTVHPKLKAMLEKRTAMTREGGVDWGMGELIAFGSLLAQGTPVRLAGQDSRRGTFVQRHAVLIDKNTADEWTPLLYLGPKGIGGRAGDGQAKFWVYDSLLSEYAAMGFEYGYSVERPDALVLWEAQFGDFANGAQTIVDEFISSSEQKWMQRSSVVLLLPHGFEGQGPDHSSARIERYLQLCAQDNMTVCYPSTPASHFHLLRRQAFTRPRRPLIVFTPKQLLRLKAATSSVEDFTTGSFEPVLRDKAPLDKKAVTRVILASARVLYDLEAEREKRADATTAILRVEQLYPVPAEDIANAVAEYPNAELVWVQDEPENQGAWPFMALNLPPLLRQNGEERGLRVVSRPASASPSTGSSKKHAVENADLMRRAFDR